MRLIDADAFIEDMKTRLWDWETVDGIQTSTALRQVITDIGNAPTVGGWISVKDRMPEPPAQCLVYSDKARRPRGMETATYTQMGWMMAAYFPEITHWMPLPEPPEEGKDETD